MLLKTIYQRCSCLEDGPLILPELPRPLLWKDVEVRQSDGRIGLVQAVQGCGRGVDPDEPVLGVLEVDRVRQVGHQGVEEIALSLERQLRLLARRDVRELADEVQRRSGRIADDGAAE